MEMEENESVKEEAKPKPKTIRLIALFLVILVIGMGIGVGANFIFGKDKVKETKGNEVDDSGNGTAKNDKDSKDASDKKNTEDDGSFSVTRAMDHISYISEQIGVRTAGSGSESKTADYIAMQLAEYGYTVEEHSFTNDDGFASRNIIGTCRGKREGYTIIVAAHYDSGVNSNGAVDNASGAGVVLDLARVFFDKSLDPTVKFVFFGSNKPGIGEVENRLTGARRYIQTLGTFEKDEIVGMISVDSVGQGEVMALKTQETGLQRLRAKLETYSNKKGVPVTLMKSAEDSDNIPFEDLEMPAVWIGWCNADGGLVTDNLYTSVIEEKVETAGELVEDFILDLSSNDLEELRY
ncbi:MAG: M28 family peptidase [Actinobacteria bacterium]|nr:M28 family peptidase [Actinomycetota bacterium]